MGLFPGGIPSHKTLLLYMALRPVTPWWSHDSGLQVWLLRDFFSKWRRVSPLMPTRAKPENDLTERSHAPELTLNLTRFPFLNGTHSALRGELLAVQGRGQQAGIPCGAKHSSPGTVCVRVCLSSPRSTAGKGHRQCDGGGGEGARKTKQLKNDVGNGTETQEGGGPLD